MVTTNPENRKAISVRSERWKGFGKDLLFTAALEASLYALNNFHTYTDKPTQIAIAAAPAAGFLARSFRRSLPVKEDESLALWRMKNNSFGIPFTLASGLIGVGVGLNVNDSELAFRSFIGLATPSAIGVLLTGGNVIDHIAIWASDSDMRYKKENHSFNHVDKRVFHWK